jgi:large-conductance mechanosensitive channel
MIEVIIADQRKMKKLIIIKYTQFLEATLKLISFIKWAGAFVAAWFSYLVLREWLIPSYEDAFDQPFASLTFRSLFSTLIDYILILLGSLFVAAIVYFIVEEIKVSIREHLAMTKNKNNLPLTYDEQMLLEEIKVRAKK